MSHQVVEIKHHGDGLYDVVLQEADSGSTKSFRFVVEEGDIQLVKPPNDFAVFMSMNLAAASLLYQAVLAFHRAHALRLPPS